MSRGGKTLKQGSPHNVVHHTKGKDNFTQGKTLEKKDAPFDTLRLELRPFVKEVLESI